MAYREMKFDRKTAKVSRYFQRVMSPDHIGPISLQVALTDSCFNRCIMCDHPARKKMHRMEVTDWVRKLRLFKDAGLESVCYSGGDPMAYTDFNDVMAAHIQLNIRFGMTITGYVPHYIDLNLLNRADWVRVSLDAVTPEVYEKVRGKTPVAKVKDGIERMVKAGVAVGLGITLHADNVADLPNVLAYADTLGIMDIETHHIVPDSGVRAVRVPEKWERKIEPFQNCHAVRYQLYIDAEGDVYPCCITAGDAQAVPQAQALGNLWVDSWDAIWEEVLKYSKLNYKELPEICRTCCIQRLSQINSIVDQLQAQDSKSFF